MLLGSHLVHLSLTIGLFTKTWQKIKFQLILNILAKIIPNVLCQSFWAIMYTFIPHLLHGGTLFFDQSKFVLILTIEIFVLFLRHKHSHVCPTLTPPYNKRDSYSLILSLFLCLLPCEDPLFLLCQTAQQPLISAASTCWCAVREWRGRSLLTWYRGIFLFGFSLRISHAFLLSSLTLSIGQTRAFHGSKYQWLNWERNHEKVL